MYITTANNMNEYVIMREWMYEKNNLINDQTNEWKNE